MGDITDDPAQVREDLPWALNKQEWVHLLFSNITHFKQACIFDFKNK